MANQTNAEAGRKVQTAPEPFPVPSHRAAPAPQRRATLSAEGEPVNIQANTPGRSPGAPIQATSSAPPSPTAPIERTTQQASTPPPPNPEQASRLSELRGENEELRQALSQSSDTVKRLERKMEEMQFMFQTQQARRPQSMQQPTQRPSRGPDPSQPVSYEQLQQFVETVSPQMLEHSRQIAVSQAIRAVWDVTPEEEQEATLRFQLQDLPEPERTTQIQHAVRRIIRPEREVQHQASAAQPPAPTRPVQQPVVPLVEGTTPQAVPEPSNRSPMEQLHAEYERVRQISEDASRPLAERSAAGSEMRRIWDQMQRLQGLDDVELQKMTGFRHVT